MRLYDGTFGCCWLIAALLGLCLLTACSSSHFQVFGVVTQDQIDAWYPTMKSSSEYGTLRNIALWMDDNMQYEPGVPFFFPDLLSAWNQRTNCEGHSRVAIEGLYHNGYDNYVLFQVNFPDGWHVMCVRKDRTFFVSNSSSPKKHDGHGMFVTTTSWGDLAKTLYPAATKYVVYDRNLVTLEEKSL